MSAKSLRTAIAAVAAAWGLALAASPTASAAVSATASTQKDIPWPHAVAMIVVAAAVWWVLLRRSPSADAQSKDSGPAPQEAAETRLLSLVGRRIEFGGALFTIVDDSAPGLPAAVSNGGRATVGATDANGNVGLLFVGFDAGGRLVEAGATEVPWSQARLVA